MRIQLKSVALIGSVFAVIVTASGCASEPGTMTSDGQITPCPRKRLRPQECGNAIFNAAHVAKINLGHSQEEVRQIMVRGPEERDARTEGGHTVETWSYLTDYDRDMKTILFFKDGKVISIEQKRR